MVEEITPAQVRKAVIQRQLSLRKSEESLRRVEEATRLEEDFNRARTTTQREDLEQLLERYDPLTAGVNKITRLAENGAKRIKDGAVKYGPRVGVATLDGIKKYVPPVAKGTLKGLGAGFKGLGTGIKWTYNNWVAHPISRVYGTLERVMVDSPVTQSAIETAGNVTRSGIKYTAISLALLGSMMYAVEAYRPGTVGRLMRETPANMVKGINSAVQEIYKALPKPSILVLPEKPVPQYNTPLSSGTTKAA